MEIFNNLCRSCNTNKEKLVNIHDIYESTMLIKDVLEYCFHTPITTESIYPKFICYDCLKELEITYRFIKRFNLTQKEFEVSYNRLQKVFEEQSNDCVTEDSVVEAYYEYEGRPLNMFENLQNVNERTAPLNSKATQKGKKIMKKAHASKYLPLADAPPKPVMSSTIACTLCNKFFFTTKALQLHLKLSHKIKIP